MALTWIERESCPEIHPQHCPGCDLICRPVSRCQRGSLFGHRRGRGRLGGVRGSCRCPPPSTSRPTGHDATLRSPVGAARPRASRRSARARAAASSARRLFPIPGSPPAGTAVRSRGRHHRARQAAHPVRCPARPIPVPLLADLPSAHCAPIPIVPASVLQRKPTGRFRLTAPSSCLRPRRSAALLSAWAWSRASRWLWPGR